MRFKNKWKIITVPLNAAAHWDELSYRGKKIVDFSSLRIYFSFCLFERVLSSG